MSFQVSNKQKQLDKENAKNDPVNSLAKATPATQDEDFCAELVEGTMDFSKIKDKQFIVAVSTGDRNKPKLLASTIRGPYSFADMVNQVGLMWEKHQHHAKVYMLETDPEKAVVFLDSGTIDYIEANYEDIAFYGALEEELCDDSDASIEAGIIEAQDGK
jgi:hypothetical protein